MKEENIENHFEYVDSDISIGEELLGEIEERIEALLYFYLTTNAYSVSPPILREKFAVSRRQRKSLEGAAMLLDVHLHESSVLFLAKIYEDFKVKIKQKLKLKVDLYNGVGFVEPECGVVTIRSLANVIKHNGSYLKKGSSDSADFIIDYWNIPSGYYLESIIIGNTPLRRMFDIPEQSFRLYQGVVKILSERVGKALPYAWINEGDMINKARFLFGG